MVAAQEMVRQEMVAPAFGQAAELRATKRLHIARDHPRSTGNLEVAE
jgi:hypothetical protein